MFLSIVPGEDDRARRKVPTIRAVEMFRQVRCIAPIYLACRLTDVVHRVVTGDSWPGHPVVAGAAREEES
jgi:hypothetical protein